MTKQDHILHRSWELPNTAAAAQQTCRKMLEYVAGAQGFDEDATFGIHLALEEAFTNAIKHGNQSNPDKKISPLNFWSRRKNWTFPLRTKAQGFDSG